MDAAGIDAVHREGDPGAINFMERSDKYTGPVDLARYSQLLTDRGRQVREWAAFLAQTPLLLLPVSTELPFPDHLDMQG